MLTIKLKYFNNIFQSDVETFKISEDTLCRDICPEIQKKLVPFLKTEFCLSKLYIMTTGVSTNIDITKKICDYCTDETIEFYYSEIVAPISEGHIDQCQTKNGSTIDFDMYPREQNHRYFPHVNAKYGGETIRITISDEPVLVGNDHFSGNNAKNEAQALAYVKKKHDFFMSNWKEIIESQY